MTESVRTPSKSERLLVRTTADELSKWKESAARDGMILSEWVRETLNAQCGPVDLGESVASTESEIVTGAPVRTKTPKEPKRCQHGTEQGWNCWQCGGMAKA